MLLRKKYSTAAGLIGGAVVGWMVLASAASAQECQKDINAINKQKASIIASLQSSMKKTHGKLDPITACPSLRRLSAVEAKFISYLTTNQAWCHVPDEALTNVKNGHRGTVAMEGKACAIAAQMRKMIKERARAQAQGNAAMQPIGPKLPSGPL